MNVDKAVLVMKNFNKALARLEEALLLPADIEAMRDSAILRFQLVYETAWRALSTLLDPEGISAKSPRSAFKAAYQQSWLEDEACWLDMIDDRNLIVHTDNEATAQLIYAHIKEYAVEMRHTYRSLEKNFPDYCP